MTRVKLWIFFSKRGGFFRSPRNPLPTTRPAFMEFHVTNYIACAVITVTED